MRVLRALLLAAVSAFAGTLPLRAQSGGQSIQSLFLGQRLCGDTRDICFAPVALAQHRYLHVIVHSVPTDTDWRVQAASACGDPMQDIGGGVPVPDSGYLESVIDLASLSPSLAGHPACFAFRGHAHYYVNYYAAYLDDSSEPDAEIVYPGYQNLAGRPDLPDLDIMYIHRDPVYAYDAVRNEPNPGDSVSFIAHILNAGGLTSASAPYEWLLDGREVQSGTLEAVPASSETTLTLPWNWSSSPHTLELRLLPAEPEISAANDTLTIRTDALTLGYWIERSAWKYFLDRQWQYCVPLACAGSDSFPDWLQRQVSVWNAMFARSGYAFPNYTTVADRVRVDEIAVVPDGSLPLHGGFPTNTPDVTDHSVDLQWGLPAEGVEHTYKDGFDGPFDVDLGLLEELGHARSLADLYRFDLQLDGNSAIDVRDAAGRPAFDASSPFDRTRPLHAFYSDAAAPYLYADASNDIMSCACARYYSPYDAMILNRIRGRRARCGNYNSPCNLGEWYVDLPAVTRIRVLDSRGRPVAGGTPVHLFFDSGTGFTAHRFVQGDGAALVTIGDEFERPQDPFRAGGSTDRLGHNLLLLEVTTAARDAFCFLEPTTLNIADWIGYADAHHPAVLTLDLRRIRRNACNLILPPARVNDPFATSPSRSEAITAATGHRHTVTVTLRADTTPGLPMHGRVVRVVGRDGRLLGHGTTNANGTVQLRVGQQPFQVIDVTDNGLVIPLVAAGHRVQAGRRL
jgi:hypothetical protein